MLGIMSIISCPRPLLTLSLACSDVRVYRCVTVIMACVVLYLQVCFEGRRNFERSIIGDVQDGQFWRW